MVHSVGLSCFTACLHNWMYRGRDGTHTLRLGMKLLTLSSAIAGAIAEESDLASSAFTAVTLALPNLGYFHNFVREWPTTKPICQRSLLGNSGCYSLVVFFDICLFSHGRFR